MTAFTPEPNSSPMERLGLLLSLPRVCNQCVSLPPPAGEGEEVHAAGGQPEATRRGEGLHVQQADLCPLQHRTEVFITRAHKHITDACD